MSFDWRTNLQNLLFYGYDIQTTQGLIATCVGFFSLSMVTEAIKRTRVHIIEKIRLESKERDDNTIEDVDTNPNVEHAEGENLLTPIQVESQRWTKSTKSKVFDGILFSLQMISSYILMLVVMTFSAWLFIAVVLGQSIGSSIFFHRPLIKVSLPKSDAVKITRESDLTTTSPNFQTEEEERHQVQDSNATENVITVEVHHI